MRGVRIVKVLYICCPSDTDTYLSVSSLPLTRYIRSKMPYACPRFTSANPKIGEMNHLHSSENVTTRRNMFKIPTIMPRILKLVLSFSLFTSIIKLMLLMIPLSPHPSGRLCRITLVDARMRRLKVGCWGAAMVAMPGQPTLSGMLCLSNNTFGQNENICQQKLMYYISIYEMSVKRVRCGPKNLTNSQRTIHTEPNMFRPDAPQSSSVYVSAGLHISFLFDGHAALGLVDHYSRLLYSIGR